MYLFIWLLAGSCVAVFVCTNKLILQKLIIPNRFFWVGMALLLPEAKENKSWVKSNQLPLKQNQSECGQSFSTAADVPDREE